jgi:signal transduction histidine kinase
VRLGVVLALVVVALFEVLALVSGVRSSRRLQARVSHEAESRLGAIRPELEAALAPGGPPAWDSAAGLALARGAASEVEVLDAAGRVVFSRPTLAPVAHALRSEERSRLTAGGTLTVVAREGPDVRALAYLPLPREGENVVLRLASLAPDLEEELRERQQVFLGHLASLAALVLAAALVLVSREERALPPAPGALHAYEQAMERLRDRGEEMSARHEAERQRLEDAVREKEALARAGELTAGIVHEVRNGLGTIVGYARLLERSSLPADATAAARSIREECGTLESVVRRFTDFVRMDALAPADVDLARLLERVVAREQRARGGAVSVRLAGLDAPLVVRADEELLERAFENLVRNALEAAAGGGGHVDVGASVDAEGFVEVSVEDDGPGLAPDHPGAIRPFYTTRPGGLGLGLPLARKVVLLHGGTLGLERREPTGVRAVARLPPTPPRV